MQIFSHHIFAQNLLHFFRFPPTTLGKREFGGNVMFCVIYIILTTLKFVFLCNTSTARRVACAYRKKPLCKFLIRHVLSGTAKYHGNLSLGTCRLFKHGRVLHLASHYIRINVPNECPTCPPRFKDKWPMEVVNLKDPPRVSP